MTRQRCACGCTGRLTVSPYWSGELCLMRWMAKVNQVQPAPIRTCAATAEKPQGAAVQACEQGAANPQVALEEPQAECGGQPGPVATWLERMFGRTT